MYFTVSAHISTVFCLALPWVVHSVLTWWVLPCQWSPSSIVNKSWGRHRWRNTRLLYTKTKPLLICALILLYFQNYTACELNNHEWIRFSYRSVPNSHLWVEERLNTSFYTIRKTARKISGTQLNIPSYYIQPSHGIV